MDLALMKDIMAKKAHISHRKEGTWRVADVARRLNKTMHYWCSGSETGSVVKTVFEYVLGSGFLLKATAAAEFGGGEDFCKYEEICDNIKNWLVAREQNS